MKIFMAGLVIRSNLDRIREMADVVDRIAATVVALCIMGGWFTEQIPTLAAWYGVLMGVVGIIFGVYTKTLIDRYLKRSNSDNQIPGEER